MIVKIDNTLEKEFWQYVSHEESLNLFIIGYVENYGFSSQYQDIWSQVEDGNITSIILKNKSTLIIYSFKNNFDIGEMKNHIKNLDVESISGKKCVIDRLISKYKDFYEKLDNKFCVLKEIKEIDFSNMKEYKIENAQEKDIDEIGKLLNRSDYKVSKNYIEERKEHLKEGNVRAYFIRNNDTMISTVSTGMEISFLAMVVSVSTDKRYRGKGLASYMVYNLSKELLLEGKVPCLFYNNDIAGKIYHNIGYKEVNEWTILFK
ncbi:UNVERIFIED_CONTAM: GNAT family N-acetyltransferase [Clostridioides difficile]|uniref:GNAT family N-acetyltransferase n=1 Tax=Clostridioides difficile TaxID=1496 RepID=UPI00038D005D|nr:GNAT family N-acetyltransferase [Clostridioides difficile]EQE86368.1 acetyltransferase domain protein [Clostridioides difficile CD69]OYO87419.1 GNAT family N-acetyltransferase [Clostridioides difficile]HBF7937126.1 GNAT family N-acetyltransferase [Clostridioides difficile]HBG6488845.1 GNAT family N-acetyltransferase [Clostridioides difficile]HBG7230060.1 GNAT family N-acetyltransferase [Clostridioides difficile]